MSRTLKCYFIIFGCCLWVNCAHAADPSGSPSQRKGSPTASQQMQEFPSIQLPETTYNFGEVIEGGEVSHEFNVKNTGKTVLQIVQVRPG